MFVALGSFLVSCTNRNASPEEDPSAVAAKSQLEMEREQLEMEREEFEQQKAAERERKRREELARKAAHASKFSVYSDAVVVTPKCFFHASPDPSTTKRSFLVEGDRVTVLKIKREFIYVEFFNPFNQKTTSGWLDTSALEPVPAEPHYN